MRSNKRLRVLLTLETKQQMIERVMNDSTPNFETAAAGAVSTTESSSNSIIPAILTPIASLLLVFILVVSFKICPYTRNRKARRSLNAAKQPRIKDNPQELSPKIYINGDIKNDDKDEESRNINDSDLLYKPFESSSSVFKQPLKEAKSEDVMITSTHGKHTMVEAQVYPSNDKEEKSSPKPCRSGNPDESDAAVPLL